MPDAAYGQDKMISENSAVGASATLHRICRSRATPQAALLVLAILGWISVYTLARSKMAPVDWPAFALSLAPVMFLLPLSRIALRRSMDRLAMVCTGSALYLAIGGCVALLTYLRFPLDAQTIDPLLVRIDAMLGFYWPDAVAKLSNHEILWNVLLRTYQSSLLQMLAVIAVLAWMNDHKRLNLFLVTYAISLCTTTGIWWLWPSFGAVAELSELIVLDSNTPLGFSEAFATEMRRLAHEGTTLITPREMTGIVAFPSFHTIMACLCVWFTWNTLLRWPFVVLNLLMIPAILSHGGHHLIDVIAGLLVFGLSLYFSHFLIRRAAA